MLEHSLLPWKRVLDGQSQFHTCRYPVIPDDALGPNARRGAKPVLKTPETGGLLRHPWSAADRGPGSLPEADPGCSKCLRERAELNLFWFTDLPGGFL